MESTQSFAPRRIVHILATLDPTDSARKLALLLEHLPGDEFEPCIIALATGSGLMRERFANRHIHAEALATGRRAAALEVISFARRLRSQPADVIHVWDDSAKRTATWAARLSGNSVCLIDAVGPLGFDPASWQSTKLSKNRQEFRARLGLPPNAKLIGTIDELDHSSRLIDVLWAVDQMRCVRDDVHLVVAGEGPQRALFERYAGLYQISERVRFIGWQSQPEEMLSQLDLYYTASVRNSLSLSLVEAMAAGLPVVASDTPAHRAAVVPRETGFLVDLRVRSELARWCLKIIEDPALAASMGAAARQRSHDCFSLEPFVEHHRRLYDAATAALV
jgi:glycosyltransferase involved in cell wall biosynthesis